MLAQKGSEPFVHAVLEGFLPEALVRRAAAEWPGPDWPHWFRYDSVLERKRVCNNWREMPVPCVTLLNLMLGFPPYAGLFPDASLWGAGMCSMAAGDHLDLHLDADHHPKTGWLRKASMVLFLDELWPATWGGNLELWSGAGAPEQPRVAIAPALGRLVWFEEGFHGIPSPLRCPAGECRKTLSLFWYGLGAQNRPRALFMGEADPEKDRARKERAQCKSPSMTS